MTRTTGKPFTNGYLFIVVIAMTPVFGAALFAQTELSHENWRPEEFGSVKETVRQ